MKSVIFQPIVGICDSERERTVRFLIPQVSALDCDPEELARRRFEEEGGPVEDVRNVIEESTLHHFYRKAYVG